MGAATCDGILVQGVLTIALIDTVGVRPGLLSRKRTPAHSAVLLAAVSESHLRLMLFTEGS